MSCNCHVPRVRLVEPIEALNSQISSEGKLGLSAFLVDLDYEVFNLKRGKVSG